MKTRGMILMLLLTLTPQVRAAEPEGDDWMETVHSWLDAAFSNWGADIEPNG